MAVWEHHTFTLPRQEAREAANQRKAEREKARVAQMTPAERARFEAKKAKREAMKKRQAAKTGKPMEDKGFLKWTDISTSRWQTETFTSALRVRSALVNVYHSQPEITACLEKCSLSAQQNRRCAE